MDGASISIISCTWKGARLESDSYDYALLIPVRRIAVKGDLKAGF